VLEAGVTISAFVAAFAANHRRARLRRASDIDFPNTLQIELSGLLC
jgi:hypothetical protein